MDMHDQDENHSRNLEALAGRILNGVLRMMIG